MDTAIVIRVGGEPERLPLRLRQAIAAGPVWLSVIGYWEVVIKTAKGRLQVGDPDRWWQQMLADLNASVLTLNDAHVAAVHRLPPLHQDPFDRALVAQAVAEDLTLISQDRALAGYAAAGCRIMA
ncbi:MAG: type II toxin-antitoxin system VapC family toxin [Terriglobales bacterium]